MPAFLLQWWTLTKKNLLIAAVRKPISTAIRAVIFPLVLVLLITYAQYFLNPAQHWGVGAASPILPLSDALSRSSASRNTVAFVHNGNTGGDIQAVIDELEISITKAHKNLIVVADEGQIPDICKSHKNGASNCYGAAVFHSSGTEPTQGSVWNYTLRADTSLGNSFNVDSYNNDAQIYLLPFQQAIDQAITKRTPGYAGGDLSMVLQYPYTEKSEEDRERDTEQSYLNAAIGFFGILFFFGMVGIVYQLTGVVAQERESGLSALVEAMMPNIALWQTRVIRLFSYFGAFTIIYLPSWLTIGIILSSKVFVIATPAVTIFYHLLSGLALCSFSIAGATLFRRAQLSGIAMTIVAVVLAVIPQVLDAKRQTAATVLVLSLLFPSANYTYFITYLARWEVAGMAVVTTKAAPLPKPNPLTPTPEPYQTSISTLSILLTVQTILYPVCAFFVERSLFSTASARRRFRFGEVYTLSTVTLQGFSKTYKQGWLSSIFRKSRNDVMAVQSLDLVARKGQILMLLGPNGSGKSTTLDAIAGLSKPTGGQIELDGSGGLGIAPQNNVLWDSLTVEEHVDIFYHLKSSNNRGTREEIAALLKACDVSQKAKAKTKTLSGGQKRKVQLAMMFAGGSAVCCVDEVSSGLDPLSRRKIWDILLAQRSSRTIIMTTHFLDEADFLSDNIAILSKGKLKAEGSSAELKQRFGNGYTIEASHNPRISQNYNDKGMQHKTFSAVDAVRATELIEGLERNGLDDYRVSGPTLEDVFLNLVGTDIHGFSVKVTAQEPVPLPPPGISEKSPASRNRVTVTQMSGVDLHNGKHLNSMSQTAVLVLKRSMVFKRKWGPHLSAFIIALLGAGVCPLFMKWMALTKCGVTKGQYDYAPPVSGYVTNLGNLYGAKLVGGPPSPRLDTGLSNLAATYGPDHTSFHYSAIQNLSDLENEIRQESSLRDFNDYIAKNLEDITPGGFWLGDAFSPPTTAWSANYFEFESPLIVNNMMNNMLSGINISTSFSRFELPPSPTTYSFGALLVTIYFSLLSCLWPALYALYPTIERLRQARALEYSNGVRVAPMWLAHLAFDFVHILAISAISTGLLSIGNVINHAGPLPTPTSPPEAAAAVPLWYNLPYLFLVLLLYGLAATLLSYVISMFAKSQLAAWVLCASGQVALCLAYFGATLGVQTNTDVVNLTSTLDKIQYSIGLVSPVANLMRSLFVALNQFTLDCGHESTPGAIGQFGSPILYLILQCFFLFGLLMLWDSGWSFTTPFRRSSKSTSVVYDDEHSSDESREMTRVQRSTSGLRVMNLTKMFGKNKAVDDVTFSVEESEVVTLLGPNGAGKCKLCSSPFSSLQRIPVLTMDHNSNGHLPHPRRHRSLDPPLPHHRLKPLHHHPPLRRPRPSGRLPAIRRHRRPHRAGAPPILYPGAGRGRPVPQRGAADRPLRADALPAPARGQPVGRHKTQTLPRHRHGRQPGRSVT